MDARGDDSDAGPQLDDADHKGYLAAVYILDANKYMRDPSGNLVWEQNQQRALERAAVWMRHYRNHPSVVMWVAGMNFFNNAVDADPRHVGRHGWDQSDQRWQRLMVAGKEMFDGLKKLDPTRAYYSHAGAYTGDVYTMNCYLDLLPLQEREDWLSEWAKSGEMPVTMTEFGTPMDCTFRRGREGFEGNITSEPLLTEYAAIYFGTDAYASEEPKYRQYLHDLFRGGMLYNSSENRLDEYADMHKIQQLLPHQYVAQLADGRSARRPAHLVVDAGRAQGGQRPDPGMDCRPGGGLHRQGPPLQLRPEVREADRPDQRYAPAPGFHGNLDRHGRREGSGQGRAARQPGGFGDPDIPIQVAAPAEEAGGKADGQITLTATIGQTTHQDTLRFGSLARTCRATARSRLSIRTA